MKKYILFLVLLILLSSSCVQIHENVRKQEIPIQSSENKTFEKKVLELNEISPTVVNDDLRIELLHKIKTQTFIVKEKKVVTSIERTLLDKNGKWGFTGGKADGDKGGFYCSFFIPWYTPVMIGNLIALPFRTIDSTEEKIIMNEELVPDSDDYKVSKINQFKIQIITQGKRKKDNKTLSIESNNEGYASYPVDKIIEFVGRNNYPLNGFNFDVSVLMDNIHCVIGTVSLDSFTGIKKRKDYMSFKKRQDNEIRQISVIEERERRNEERKRSIEIERQRRQQMKNTERELSVTDNDLLSDFDRYINKRIIVNTYLNSNINVYKKTWAAIVKETGRGGFIVIEADYRQLKGEKLMLFNDAVVSIKSFNSFKQIPINIIGKPKRIRGEIIDKVIMVEDYNFIRE